MAEVQLDPNTEEWHSFADNFQVYRKTWKDLADYSQTAASPVALLLFVHGFSDHCNRYPFFFRTLVSRGIQCYSFDQRGWGRSVHKLSQQGLTGPTKTVLSDITAILQTILSTEVAETTPIFLMGHSMGGAEVLQWMVHGPAALRARVQGFLTESPYIALHPASQPNPLTVIAGRLAAKVAPKKRLVQKLDVQWVSRDKEICKDYEEDALCHNTGTLEGLAGMLDRAQELDSGAVVPSEGPLWIGHGDEDRITSHEASKKFFGRLKFEDKQLRIFQGCYHQLHAEPGDEKLVFANEVADWILERSRRDSREAKSKL